MGLLSAINNAVSGLNVNQQNLNVLSQNISNANTPNYSAEKLNQQADFIDGTGTGVSSASITRTVNQFLQAEVQSQTSVSSAASTAQSYYSQIENLLGSPGSTGTIDQNITSFFTSLQNLANSPSVSAQAAVINTATTATNSISTLAGSLQGLRYQADQQISSAVTSINSDLSTINNVNTALERATATNQSTAGLLDQRDAALNDLAQYIGITPVFSNDGEAAVNTSSGVTLLSPGTLTQLNYTAASGTNAFVSNQGLSPITVSVLDPNGNVIGNPTTLVTGGISGSATNNIASSFTSGSLQSLITMRDSVLPGILSQLDTLASTVTSQVNAVSNAGTSFPPPNSYTGTTPVAGTTTSQYTGSVQIAVLDAGGNPIASPYADETNGVQPLTLNLATLSAGGNDSVNSIINAINQYYGPPQNKAEIGNINNVQLGVVSNNVPDTGSTLSFNFNLNNISGGSEPFTVTGIQVLNDSNTVIADSSTTGVSALPAAASVGSGQTANTGTITATLGGAASAFYTVKATVQTTDSNGNPVTSTISYVVNNNLTNSAGDLIGAASATTGATIVAPTTTAALATATLVDANGNPLPKNNGVYATTQGFLKITANNSTQTIAINELDSKQTATGQGFSQYFGLNNFFNVNQPTATGSTVAGSALNFSVASKLVANPGLISAGVLAQGNQPTDPTAKPNFTYRVASGDNSVAQQLAGLATSQTGFSAVGGMPSSTTTLSQYAGQIIALASTNSTTATNSMNDSQTLLNGFTSRAQAVSGVNLDQELANTVIYQNAYTASTRVITVVSTMFTELLGIIQ